MISAADPAAAFSPHEPRQTPYAPPHVIIALKQASCRSCRVATPWTSIPLASAAPRKGLSPDCSMQSLVSSANTSARQSLGSSDAPDTPTGQCPDLEATQRWFFSAWLGLSHSSSCSVSGMTKSYGDRNCRAASRRLAVQAVSGRRPSAALEGENIDAGRQVARNQGTEFLNHGHVGHIRNRDSHGGNDPFPHKG